MARRLDLFMTSQIRQREVEPRTWIERDVAVESLRPTWTRANSDDCKVDGNVDEDDELSFKSDDAGPLSVDSESSHVYMCNHRNMNHLNSLFFAQMIWLASSPLPCNIECDWVKESCVEWCMMVPLWCNHQVPVSCLVSVYICLFGLPPPLCPKVMLKPSPFLHKPPPPFFFFFYLSPRRSMWTCATFDAGEKKTSPLLAFINSCVRHCPKLHNRDIVPTLRFAIDYK